MDAIIHAMGTLFIVATPIGNLEDITIRAIKTLLTVDFIACEDTRRTGILLAELKKRNSSVILNESADWRRSEESRTHVRTHSDIRQRSLDCARDDSSQRLVPYHDHNEANATAQLMEYLTQGKSVALVTDAGTPLISDPGYLLVKECRKRDVPVVSVPGPAAFLTALTSSGLPANHFLYLGYPPEKQSHRLQLFQELFQCFKTLKHIAPTIIFYCAPHKLEANLKDMQEVFGDIEITLARELTKIHEQIWTGPISQALTTFPNPKGEFVILFRLT